MILTSNWCLPNLFLTQAAQTLFVIYKRDSIALRFEPFKRMYENGSKIALNSICSKRFNPIQTGLFWSIFDWGGGGGAPRSPLCISGTNNARVMIFTHNDHLRTKKTHTQFSLATPHDDVTVTSYSDFSMFLIIFPLRNIKYQKYW